MELMQAGVAGLCVLLLIYLFVALLKPEVF